MAGATEMIVNFILLALGVYAITQSVTRYDGLGHCFLWLRNKASGQLRELVNCPVCLGWYVSLLATIGAYTASTFVNGWYEFVLTWLALVGANALASIWSDQ